MFKRGAVGDDRRSVSSRPALRDSFAARLLVSVAIALTVVGVSSYVLVARSVHQALISTGMESQRREIEAIQIRAERYAGTPRAQFELSTIVREMAERSDLPYVALVDAGGHVLAKSGVAGNRTAQLGVAQQTVDAGRASAGLRPDSRGGDERFQVVMPVRAGRNRYALIVEHDTAAYAQRVSAVHARLISVGVPGGVAILVLVWLLGGRVLRNRHRSALARTVIDELTGLGNHRTFRDELGRAADETNRSGEPFTLALLDLDDFTFANDRHGHRHGDQLLARAARTLAGGRPQDRAFRIGGDEFALLLPRTNEQGALAAVERLQRALRTQGIPVGVGVSTLRPDMLDPVVLREEADAALAEAKRSEAREPVPFSRISAEVSLCTPAHVEAVRRLLRDGRTDVAFQPIWHLAGQRLLGVEALARPTAEALAGPAEAFDIAEQIGRVHELDALCVRSILGRAGELPGDVLLFVNVTPASIVGHEDELDWLLAEAQRAGIAARRIVIEVTERGVTRPAALVRGCHRLRELGFKGALDDVGAGNAGLEVLRGFTFDFVKIDRGVVAAAAHDASARAVLCAIGAFARETSTFVIAEGIEDDATLNFVSRASVAQSERRQSIHGVQGYGLGRPKPTLAEAIAPAPRTGDAPVGVLQATGAAA